MALQRLRVSHTRRAWRFRGTLFMHLASRPLVRRRVAASATWGLKRLGMMFLYRSGSTSQVAKLLTSRRRG